MNISKIIVCAVSFASVGFAVENDYTENRSVGSRGSVVKPVKRAIPKGGDVSANKSKPGVDRQALVDVTNGQKRISKPNPRYLNSSTEQVLDSSTEKVVKKKAVAGRKKVKAKRPANSAKRASPTQSAAVFTILSDDSSSGHTTPAEGSMGSRTASFDSSRASSPVLGGDDVADGDDALNTSFGSMGLQEDKEAYKALEGDSWFGSDFDEDDARVNVLLASPVATRQILSAAVIVPKTPTEEDWRYVLGLAAQDATPFELGGTYKGDIYTPFDPDTYADPLFSVIDPLSPIGQAEFDSLVEEMYPERFIF